MNSRQALPGARFLEMDDECMGMRMVKTAEEIALTQRAMNYHSDNVLVTKTKGVQMGSAPFTKEWCFLTL